LAFAADVPRALGIDAYMRIGDRRNLDRGFRIDTTARDRFLTPSSEPRQWSSPHSQL